MDIKRTNQLILAVINHRRADDICKDDAEREQFAMLEWERDSYAEDGIALSPINEIT